MCLNICLCFLTEYAEKYQELLVRQDFFHDAYGENGNEVYVQQPLIHFFYTGKRVLCKNKTKHTDTYLCAFLVVAR